MAKFPCPCCGYLVFSEPPGSDNICPICFWEDDLSQLRFVRTTGANRVNLMQAQRNFAQFGASEPRLKQRVRQAAEGEHQEPGWRPIDETRDNTEELSLGVDYGLTYPDDRTVLYYWRSNYWRSRET